MKNPFKVLVLIALSALVFGGVFLFALPQNSHHTNFRYVLWKHHLYTYPENKPPGSFFGVDLQFRNSLIGKTKDEIRSWFPDLIPPKDGDPYQIAYYSDVSRTDFLWIANSNWGFEFEDGRVKRIRLIKG
jgi:hypothetical protein